MKTRVTILLAALSSGGAAEPDAWRHMECVERLFAEPERNEHLAIWLRDSRLDVHPAHPQSKL